MTVVSPLRKELETAQVAHQRRIGQLESLQQQVTAKEAELESIRVDLTVFEKARLILKRMADLSRESARRHIETIVTRALQYVFGSNYRFEIEIPDKERPEADFLVVTNMNGVEVRAEPKDANGGGIIDVLSLSLQVAMLILYRPAVERVLILDEPAKYVSEEHVGAVAKFFKFIAEEFDVQIIYVTHNRYLAEMADATFRIRLRDGISRVE